MSTLIICDDDFATLRRQLSGFGDDPDVPCLYPIRVSDDASDVIGIDCRARRTSLTS